MGNETHRRDALKVVGATLATGSLAGCSGLLSGEMTFAASPATMDVIYDGSEWGDRSSYDSGTPEGARPVVQPIAGAEIVIDDSAGITAVNRDVTVTSYAVTHSVEAPVAGESESRTKSLGEIVAFTTPKTGALSTYSNPATGIDLSEVVGSATFGQDQQVEPSSVDGPTGTFEFDQPPEPAALFQTAYGGNVASMNLDGEPGSASGGLEGSGTVTFTDPDSGEALAEDDPLAGVPCSVAGAKVGDGGDAVYLVGWFWDQSDRPVDMTDPATLLGVGEGAGGAMDLVGHPGDCPDAGCRPDLVRSVREGRATVVERRFQATESAAASMQTLAQDLTSAVSDVQSLQGTLSGETDDGDTERANALEEAGNHLDGFGSQLGDVQSDLDDIETVAGNARDTVSPDSLSTVSQTTGDLRVSLNVVGGKSDGLLTSAQDAHDRIATFLSNRSDADSDFDTLESDLSSVVDTTTELGNQIDVTLSDVEYAHGWVAD